MSEKQAKKERKEARKITENKIREQQAQIIDAYSIFKRNEGESEKELVERILKEHPSDAGQLLTAHNLAALKQSINATTVWLSRLVGVLDAVGVHVIKDIQRKNQPVINFDPTKLKMGN